MRLAAATPHVSFKNHLARQSGTIGAADPFMRLLKKVSGGT